MMIFCNSFFAVIFFLRQAGNICHQLWIKLLQIDCTVLLCTLAHILVSDALWSAGPTPTKLVVSESTEN